MSGDGTQLATLLAAAEAERRANPPENIGSQGVG